jgi:hypothetical protein
MPLRSVTHTGDTHNLLTLNQRGTVPPPRREADSRTLSPSLCSPTVNLEHAAIGVGNVIVRRAEVGQTRAA